MKGTTVQVDSEMEECDSALINQLLEELAVENEELQEFFSERKARLLVAVGESGLRYVGDRSEGLLRRINPFAVEDELKNNPVAFVTCIGQQSFEGNRIANEVVESLMPNSSKFSRLKYVSQQGIYASVSTGNDNEEPGRGVLCCLDAALIAPSQETFTSVFNFAMQVSSIVVLVIESPESLAQVLMTLKQLNPSSQPKGKLMIVFKEKESIGCLESMKDTIELTFKFFKSLNIVRSGKIKGDAIANSNLHLGWHALRWKGRHVLLQNTPALIKEILGEEKLETVSEASPTTESSTTSDPSVCPCPGIQSESDSGGKSESLEIPPGEKLVAPQPVSKEMQTDEPQPHQVKIAKAERFSGEESKLVSQASSDPPVTKPENMSMSEPVPMIPRAPRRRQHNSFFEGNKPIVTPRKISVQQLIQRYSKDQTPEDKSIGQDSQQGSLNPLNGLDATEAESRTTARFSRGSSGTRTRNGYLERSLAGIKSAPEHPDEKNCEKNFARRGVLSRTLPKPKLYERPPVQEVFRRARSTSPLPMKANERVNSPTASDLRIEDQESQSGIFELVRLEFDRIKGEVSKEVLTDIPAKVELSASFLERLGTESNFVQEPVRSTFQSLQDDIEIVREMKKQAHSMWSSVLVNENLNYQVISKCRREIRKLFASVKMTCELEKSNMLRMAESVLEYEINRFHIAVQQQRKFAHVLRSKGRAGENGDYSKIEEIKLPLRKRGHSNETASSTGSDEADSSSTQLAWSNPNGHVGNQNNLLPSPCSTESAAAAPLLRSRDHDFDGKVVHRHYQKSPKISRHSADLKHKIVTLSSEIKNFSKGFECKNTTLEQIMKLRLAEARILVRNANATKEELDNFVTKLEDIIRQIVDLSMEYDLV